MEPPEQWTAVDRYLTARLVPSDPIPDAALAALEKLAEEFAEVREAMAVDTGAEGQDGVRLLFVVLRPGKVLDDALRAAINARLRTWVPNAIYAAPELPRTHDGGKHEAVLGSIFTGGSVENASDRETVANPEALRYFVDLFNNL